eukprot:1640179-Pyramimonas_sp.AAC.1
MTSCSGNDARLKCDKKLCSSVFSSVGARASLRTRNLSEPINTSRAAAAGGAPRDPTSLQEAPETSKNLHTPSQGTPLPPHEEAVGSFSDLEPLAHTREQSWQRARPR